MKLGNKHQAQKTNYIQLYKLRVTLYNKIKINIYKKQKQS